MRSFLITNNIPVCTNILDWSIYGRIYSVFETFVKWSCMYRMCRTKCALRCNRRSNCCTIYIIPWRWRRSRVTLWFNSHICYYVCTTKVRGTDNHV